MKFLSMFWKFLGIILFFLTVSIDSILPAASAEWSDGGGCGFARLGGCRNDIRPGERFTAPRAYAFLNSSDQTAWKSMEREYRTGKRKDFIPVSQAQGVVHLRPDVIMTARTYLRVCCPGGSFEGVVEHPEFGEIYAIELGRL